MNVTESGKRMVSPVLEFIEFSARRCHFIGLIPATLLAVAVVLTSTGGVEFWGTQHPDAELTAIESAALGRNSDLWKQYDTKVDLEVRAVAFRQRQLGRWIRDRAQWPVERQRIEQIADQFPVLIEPPRLLQTQTGRRVAVLEAEIWVAGRYEAIVRLASQLTADERPVWCSEIEITSASPGPNFARGASIQPDQTNEFVTIVPQSATQSQSGRDREADLAVKNKRRRDVLDDPLSRTARIVLRIPFAGEGSAAGNLWSEIRELSRGL